jgi:hypothetical protein
MIGRRSSRLRIVVTGLIAQHPGLAGVAWDYVQYVLGLAQLGHDVYYVEDSGEWPYPVDARTSTDRVVGSCRPNAEHLDSVMRRWGLGDRWAYRCPLESGWYGLAAAKRRDVLGSADLLLNVSGSLSRPNEYRGIPLLAYIDSDPGFTQVKLRQARGYKRFQRRVASHDVFFSFGERFSDRVPATPYAWKPTRQPIAISEWRVGSPSRNAFTTVMSWASYRPLRYRRTTYGQKDIEFGRFLELPTRVGNGMLEVAMGGTRHAEWETARGQWPARVGALIARHADWTPQQLLRASGWNVADATVIGASLDNYRAYIESSMAEWSVAKNGYVVGQAGWFSCRSACYLAAGKPVVVQDTGFSGVLPVGEGILSFRSFGEAADAIESVRRNYKAHAKTARTIAEEFFDARKVLAALVDNAYEGSRVAQRPNEAGARR